MNTQENIEKLITELVLPGTKAADERIVNDALSAYEKSETDKAVLTQPNIWRILITSRITKYAAAAIVIIAVLIGISHFDSSVSSTITAYASVVNALQNIDTVHLTGWTCRLWESDKAPRGDYALDMWEWYTENGEWRRYFTEQQKGSY